MAAEKGDGKGTKKHGKKEEKKAPPRKKVETEHSGQPMQIFDGPIWVSNYGSSQVQMVGYRDGSKEWWGMVTGYRLGPSSPGSVNRTMTYPSGAPTITNAAQFVAWALPILQSNNPGKTFEWEACTITSI
ncbi:MAG: hypothetical protein H6738_19155 [Alphaproteobacteria bacterium]|nr:hypothetical protein [Alphaproteobacteria bacterium]MCB9698908.1 hypothetical protein [Alphaproteobacteria bacterium]